MKSSIIAGMLAVLCVCACSEGGNTESEEVFCEGDTVIVSNDSPILSRIHTAEAETRPVSTEFRTYGTIQARNGNFARVCVPFDGRIIRSHVQLGQKVRAGDILFELSSSDYFESCREYLQAVHTYDRMKTEYERKKGLKENGIVSERELLEAFTEMENSRHDKEFAEAALRVYGTDPSKVSLGETMKVIAPISGEIVENRLITGLYLKADDEAPVTIADLREVWINAPVKERYISNISKGEKAEVITEADPDDVYAGTVLNVGQIVDESTRSIQVVVSCDNPGLKLKHGMYVAVRFLNEEALSIVLPSTAVFQGGGESFVYVMTGPSSFTRRTVTTGPISGSNDCVSILSGLEEGETVVTDGGLYLNN
ncbi:MAG: efflux RND transporter periplasmic adaptor subunit [Bacteroidales bacterium]|nr:efflux RND transporter periplasmic adaptor subunit [Bacteroidales bacterium]